MNNANPSRQGFVRIACASLGIGLALWCLLLPSVAKAATYSSGSYSECIYSEGCPPTPQGGGTTIVTTPDGFEFAINLSDGQAIPAGLYTVTVTALHGSDAMFTKVEFYVDGNLVYTAQADGSGTFRWPWDTRANPGNSVRVVVYENSGAVSDKTFSVTIRDDTTNNTPTPSTGNGDQGGGFFDGLKHAIRSLPPALVYAFPYILFLLLFATIVLLLLQVLRELREVRGIERQVAHNKLINEQKATFVGLASHYLRTPLTVMSGAGDLAASTRALPLPVWQAINAQVRGLAGRVEELLKQINSPEQPTPAAQTPLVQAVQVWKQAGFIFPVVLTGIMVVLTDLLVGVIAELSLSFINILTQIAVFVMLSVSLYVLLRMRVLHNHRVERSRQALAQEVRIDQLRNRLIHESVAAFGVYLEVIHLQQQQLQSGASTKLLDDGYRRFIELLDRFRLAERLEAGLAPALPERFLLVPLLQQAAARASAAGQAKQVQISYPQDRELTYAHPAWLGFVAASIIDNAVAYSPPGARVVIEADGQAIRISDTGPGIAKEQLEQLFHPFSRAEDVTNFTHEGMGFSLYLSRLVMTWLGGGITVHSAPGRGTTVTIGLRGTPR